MSNTIFFKEYIIYKPDINKIEDENVVDKLINCKNNCFHSFKFNCICDVEFRDIKNKNEIQDDGLFENV